jgi:hypothetical protein
VKIQEAIEKLQEDSGLPVSRPMFYHHDRKKVFGNIERLDNGYRDIDPTAYKKMGIAVGLADVGCDIREIKEAINGEVPLIDILRRKSNTIRFLNTLI